jgi:hypothetical protein
MDRAIAAGRCDRVGWLQAVRRVPNVVGIAQGGVEVQVAL